MQCISLFREAAKNASVPHLRLVLSIGAIAALVGCASGDPSLRPIEGPSLELHEKQIFSAISVGTTSPQYYNALLPGVYKAELEDRDGVYYQAASSLVVLGGHVDSKGQREEPLAYGGFWLAKSKDHEPPVKIYYLPKAPRAGVLLNGVLVPDQGEGRKIRGGLRHMGIAFEGIDEAIGVRPNTGEPLFVPQKNGSELSRFRAEIAR